MGTMVTGFWITLRNSAGVLDREFVPGGSSNDIKRALHEMIDSTPEFMDGDSLTVTDGESEQ